MAGRAAPSAGAPLNVPPVLASNFELGSERAYSRDDATPTWEAFEELLGGLEGGEAVAFASGMGAVAAVFDLLPVGATVVLGDDCYQAVAGLAAAGAAQGRWRVVRVGVEDTARWLELAADADLLWLESPSNPLLAVADLPAICAAPRKPDALDGGRQHVRHAAGPAAAGAGRRPGRALGHEVPGRPLRSAARRRGRGVRRARAPAARATQAGRSHARRARGLPRRPRDAHARVAASARERVGRRARRAARRSTPGGGRALPRPPRPSDPRDRAPLHGRLRRRRVLRRRAAAPSVPTPSADRCGSSATPPAWAASSRPSNAAPPSPARPTSRPACCGSASDASIPTTSGATSNRRSRNEPVIHR